MVDLNRGGTQRVQEEAETEDMSPGQRRAAVKDELDQMDKELTDARYSNELSIDRLRSDVLEAYTDRIVDIFE